MQITIVSLLAASCLFAQQAPLAKQTEEPTTKEIRQEFYAVTNSIRQAADKMPESAYSFQPASGMRTFGELVLHIADVQSKTCGSILKDSKPLKAAAASKSSKADLQEALAASFDECYEAFSELSAQNKDSIVSSPAGDRTRLAALTMLLGHDNEEYGYMAVYLRLKNVVPPSSADSGAKEYKGGAQTKP